MIFLKFWWLLLVFSPGFALGTKDEKQQPSDGSDTSFSQLTVQKSKLKTEKENWPRLKEVDDWCLDDTNGGNTQMCSDEQQKESLTEKNEEDIEQDYTPMKCPAMLNEPEDSYELHKMELSDRFHKVLSGRLPEELTDIAFELIHNDTEFEQVLSVLERNLKALNETLVLQVEKEKDFCEIVIKQKCRRDSNPLIPRLQQFYDMILKTPEEEQRIREKRQESLWILAEDYTNRISQHQNMSIGSQLAKTEVHDEL